MDESEMTEYQKWEKAKLDDIDCDTDTILKKMGGKNMGDHFDMGMLTGLMQGRGVDTGELIALLNNKQGGWGDQGGIWLILLFLIILGGGNLGGLGRGNDIAGLDFNTLNNAITAQGIRQETAIGNIANTLGCSFGQVQAALASVDKQIAVNQGSITNAIQSCCCSLNSAIDKCCCQTNLNIERTGNGLSRELGGAIRDLSGQLANQTVMINDRFCALELREKQNQIDELRARVLEQSQDAQTALLLNAIESIKG